MGSSRENTGDQEEDHYQYRRHRVTKISDNVQTLTRTLGVVAVFYIIYLTLTSFAGKESSATLRFATEVITTLRIDQVIAYLVGIFGLGYGLLERQLRREYIEDFSARIEKLESWIDEGRSSSGLPSSGTTHPQD